MYIYINILNLSYGFEGGSILNQIFDRIKGFATFQPTADSRKRSSQIETSWTRILGK